MAVPQEIMIGNRADRMAGEIVASRRPSLAFAANLLVETVIIHVKDVLHVVFAKTPDRNKVWYVCYFDEQRKDDRAWLDEMRAGRY